MVDVLSKAKQGGVKIAAQQCRRYEEVLSKYLQWWSPPSQVSTHHFLARLHLDQTSTLSVANMGGVASIPTDPSRTVQVISAGYSRTGTVSMSMALDKLLDGPILHGGTQIFVRDDGENPQCLFSTKVVR